MRPHIVKVKSVDEITHDVLRIVTNKPLHFQFKPGQATEVSINQKGWENKKRPFTFTCLPEDRYLEFTIKTYPEHEGVTNRLLGIKKNGELILHEVFGAIRYKGEGIFIAGGAGVTPFISILRNLHSHHTLKNNKLIFANKTVADIIHKKEFKKLLGDRFINILSEQKAKGCFYGRITKSFLKEHLDESTQKVYICGPPPMMHAMEKLLIQLHIDKKSIIKEVF